MDLTGGKTSRSHWCHEQEATKRARVAIRLAVRKGTQRRSSRSGISVSNKVIRAKIELIHGILGMEIAAEQTLNLKPNQTLNLGLVVHVPGVEKYAWLEQGAWLLY